MKSWVIKVDDETYDLVTVDGVRRARFTLNRDTATARDDVELLGLDHPLVQEELGRWRSVPPSPRRQKACAATASSTANALQ